MKNKDRLIEINGVNVQNLDHAQVVSRFHALSDSESVELLVTDVSTYEKYQVKKQRIHSTLPHVRIMESNIPLRSAFIGTYIFRRYIRELKHPSEHLIDLLNA